MNSKYVSMIFLTVLSGIVANDVNADGVDDKFRPKDAAANLVNELQKKWPHNRTVKFVFHGHSVPAGYFKTPKIQRFDSYPMLFQKKLCERFPTAAIDVSITAIGGEHSQAGAARFARDVLAQNPDVVFIDYSLNDRRLGLQTAQDFWEVMIVEALQNKVVVVLLTATPDSNEDILDDATPLQQHADQVKRLADKYQLPLVDSYAEFKKRVAAGESIEAYLSQPNHPNRKGHEVVSEKLLQLFPVDKD